MTAALKIKPKPHGLSCLEYKVLVRPLKAQNKTVGGIHLPEAVVEKDQHASMEGVICDISPFAFGYEEWSEEFRKPQIGDTVIFARYAGINVKGNDSEDYRLMNDKDVVAVRSART